MVTDHIDMLSGTMSASFLTPDPKVPGSNPSPDVFWKIPPPKYHIFWKVQKIYNNMRVDSSGHRPQWYRVQVQLLTFSVKINVQHITCSRFLWTLTTIVPGSIPGATQKTRHKIWPGSIPGSTTNIGPDSIHSDLSRNWPQHWPQLWGQLGPVLGPLPWEMELLFLDMIFCTCSFCWFSTDRFISYKYLELKLITTNAMMVEWLWRIYI